MKKIGLFLTCAFLLLFLASSAEGETFASVPLYISGEPEGTLSIDSPSGSKPLMSKTSRAFSGKLVDGVQVR